MPGDLVEMFYDDAVLGLEPPAARCVAEPGGYSVWWKPSGLLSEGNDYGDHCWVRPILGCAFTNLSSLSAQDVIIGLLYQVK